MQYSGITLTPGLVITAATDPQFNYVTALLHGDGTNTGQNNTFLDSSINNFTVTRSGSTTQGSFAPFGTLWSNYFPGSSNLLFPFSAAFNLTSDFTIEFWVYRVSGAGMPLNCGGGLNIAYASYEFNYDGNNINFAASSTNANYDIGSETGATGSLGVAPLNAWNHIAVTRTGNVYRGFINGVQGYTQTLALTPYSQTTRGLSIGANYSTTWGTGTPTSGIVGYLSNVRIVKGTSLYTANFTPPTQPLTAITNTSVLTCQSNRFKDNSTNNFAITISGSPAVQIFSPFGTTTQYNPAVIGGSAYFNGSTDYLTAPTGTAFQFAGDFTIEAWVYSLSATGQSNYSCIFDTRATNTSSTTGIVVNLTPSGYLNFYINGNNYTSATLLGANNWTHVALVRSGSTISMYQNGVSVASVVYATSLSSGYFWTGALAGPAASGYWQGYISNLRVVNGTAVYTANFTPPTIPLSSIGNTSLLLSGTNGQIFGSAMTNNFVTVSNAQVSTSIYKYGTGSIFFNGTTDYLTAPSSPLFAFGTGAWTVEAWVYVTTLQEILIFDTRTSGSTAGVGLRIEPTTGKLTYSGSANNSLTGTGSTNGISANIWTHIAWVYDGVTLTGYINGQISGSATPSFNITQNNCVIGRVGFASSGFMAGYIDEFRITNGIARYTSNFTAPTSQFPSTGPIPVPTPNVEYLVVAGGGGGGWSNGGGGGAGGYRTNTGLSVTAGSAITVTIGTGGAGSGSGHGSDGTNSVFGSITSTGGGGGGAAQAQGGPGNNGGSGGGGGNDYPRGTATAGGTGNSGGYTPAEGTAGGASQGGGGGASTAGSNGATNGVGGAGAYSSITGVSVARGGGGGGSTESATDPVLGGVGGGGNGQKRNSTAPGNGTVNTGGGGGGGANSTGGTGGSGVVIIRYTNDYLPATSTTGSPSITNTGGYWIYAWTSSGSITF